MSVLGWFLAVGGLAGIVFALRMMMKAKKMQSVPFRTPSEIAKGGPSVADAKGMVSTEGTAEPGAQPLAAPMSGQPCLAYEIKIERKWEKQIQTEKGFEKKTGSDKVMTQYQGSQFKISDGAGSVDVDASKEPDAPFESSHSSTIKVGMVVPGTLQFGQMQLNTPLILPDAGRTSAFVGTEKIIKPGTIYALGQLQNGTITTPSGAFTGKLTLSSKGRAHLLASTKRNMILGYAIGGVLALGGTTLGIFGPKPAKGNDCDNFTGTIACSGKITKAEGRDLKWIVQNEGTYHVVVKQPKVKFPIDATLTITDLMGKQVAYNDGGSPGADAEVTQKFAPGIYTVNVRDFAKHVMSGGYSYSLEVKQVEDAASAPVAAIAPAEGEPSETCQRAIDCCIAISGKGSTAACEAFKKAQDAACESALKGYKVAAKHVKGAKAACGI